MAVSYTGYTSKTPERYLLDAGAIYKNLIYDEITGEFTGTLLGATSGGNEFTLSQTTRVIQVDGVKGAAKGNIQIDEEVPQLTVNLKELTAQNIATAIAGSKTTSDEFYDIITGKGIIELSDYLDNIAFVGRLSRNSKPVVIVVENAISLEGLSVKTADKGEAIVPVVFRGTYDEATLDAQEGPYKIYWPKEVEGE